MTISDKICEKLEDLHDREMHFRQHIKYCIDMEDWHGVQDGGSGIRDIHAEQKTLKWVLELLNHPKRHGLDTSK